MIKRTFFLVILFNMSGIFARPNDNAKKETITAAQVIKSSFSSKYYYPGLQLLLMGAYEGADLLTQESFERGTIVTPNPQFIQDIIFKMNIPGPTLFFLTDTRHTGYAIDSDWFNSITLDNDFYNNAPPEEKIFVVGHEFAHLKNNHVGKKGALGIVGTPLIIAAIFAADATLDSTISAIKHKFNVKEEGYCARFLEAIKKGSHICSRSPLFHWWVIKCCYNAFSRRCEREADRDAALILNCAKGGILFFTKLMVENRLPQSLLGKLLHKIDHTLGFVSHPSHAERITDLHKLV